MHAPPAASSCWERFFTLDDRSRLTFPDGKDQSSRHDPFATSSTLLYRRFSCAAPTEHRIGERGVKATVIAVEIVRKNPDQVGFAVDPRRWLVERFFAWIGRNRRLAEDFEATVDSSARLPLCRVGHAACSPCGARFMTFETDSQAGACGVRRSGVSPPTIGIFFRRHSRNPPNRRRADSPAGRRISIASYA